MQFVFLKGKTQLIMPVTPEGYEIPTGRKMETINISALGDVFRPGGRSRFSKSVQFLLPAQSYTFMEAGSKAEPEHYISQLTAWSLDNSIVRFIISGTTFNLQVYIESISVAEKDGSGDRYITVAMREYVETAAVQTTDPTAAQAQSRSAPEGPPAEQSYTIKQGDSLAMLCRRFYGNGTAKYYNALAKYNSIRNAALIYAGRTIKIPTETVLLGGGT